MDPRHEPRAQQYGSLSSSLSTVLLFAYPMPSKAASCRCCAFLLNLCLIFGVLVTIRNDAGRGLTAEVDTPLPMATSRDQL